MLMKSILYRYDMLCRITDNEDMLMKLILYRYDMLCRIIG
jgi:hypothetical protein